MIRQIIPIVVVVAAAATAPAPPPIAMVSISAGRFVMGSPLSESGRNADETAHQVTISRGFLLGQHEVTQREWRAVMGTNPSFFSSCGPACPVERVSYVAVERFLDALNAVAEAASAPLHYRLPTEAEWEYACRAGTTTPFSTGENISTELANYNGTFPYGVSPGLNRKQPIAAGTLPPNPWGLSDMHGNVWEWTSDCMRRIPRAPRRSARSFDW